LGGNNIADVQRLTIVADPSNVNGSALNRIGAGNAVFGGTNGIVGISAANVQVQSAVVIGDINATGSAIPTLNFGSNSQFGSVTVAGGDLVNSKTINNSGYQYDLALNPGSTSGGTALPAQETYAQLTFTQNPASVAAAIAAGEASKTPSFTVTATQIVQNNAQIGDNAMTLSVGNTGNANVTLETDAITSDGGFIVSGNANVTLTSGGMRDVISLVGNGNNTLSTGGGNDSVTIYGTGTNTINVGKGVDDVTGGTGNDTVVFGSADFTAADVVNAGEGIDTVIITGDGNVADNANLVSVENLVLNGATLTIGRADLATYLTNGLSSITGQADSSKLIVQAAAGDTIDLTGVSISTLKNITVDAVGGAGNVTLKLSAEQIAAVTGFSAATGDTLTINTTVAGFNALGSKAGTATITLTDTLANLIAGGDAIKGLTASVGELSVAGANQALAITSTVTYTIKDTAANLALGSKAIFDKATKITASNAANAAQAAALDSLLDTSTFVRSGTSLVYSVTDTAENLATQTSGLGDATNVTATTAATAKEASAIAAGAAAGKATYAVADTVANLNTAIGVAADLTALNSATGVTISDKVTDVAALQAINTALNVTAGGLTKVNAGYALEEQYSDLVGNTTEADAAGNIKVTDSLNVTQANAIEALNNTGTNSYAISDSTVALLGASSVVVSNASAAASSTATISVSDLNALVSKFGTTKLADTTLAVEGTVAELATLSSGALAEIRTASQALGGNGILQITAGSKSSLAEVLALRTNLGTTYANLLPAYTITDTVANLTAGAAVTDQLTVLNAASSVVVSDTATVAQVKNLNDKLLAALGGLTSVASGYTLTDTAANLASGAASTVGIVDNASKITVSGTASVAQVNSIAGSFGLNGAAAVLGTDVVFTLRDSASNILGAAAGVRTGATSFSISDTSVTVATADALLLNAKFDKAYAIKDGVAVLKGSGAALLATLSGASSVTLSDTVANLSTADGDLARARAGQTIMSDSLAALTGATDEVKSVVTKFEVNAPVNIAADVAAVNALSAIKPTIYTIAPAGYASLTGTGSGVATFVANAASVSVSDDVTVARANVLLGKVTGTISYNIADTAANLANADASVLAKDTSGAAITGSTLVNAAQASTLYTRSIGGYTISDTAENLSATTAAVITSVAGGNGVGVTVSDGGLTNVNVAVAAKIYGTNGNSAGNYNITDTAANLTGANPSLVGFSQNVTATTAATAAQANALKDFKSMGTITFDVSDTAANLANPATALGVNAARNLSLSSGSASLAQAVAIQAATNSGTVSYSISDDATNLVTNGIASGNAVTKADSIAALEAASGTVTITGTVTAAQANSVAALTKAVVYSISDTAANLGLTTVTAGALSEAKDITVSDTATVALAAKLISAGNSGIVTINTVSGKSADLAGLTKASDDVITNVTATDNSTVSQATAIVALGSALGTKTYTLSDTGANLAAASTTLLTNAGRIAGATADIIATNGVTIAQAETIRAANSDFRYSISDTYSNLMANSDVAGDVDADAIVTAATKITVSDGALTVAQSNALLAVDPALTTKYVFSIVDNDAGLVNAMTNTPATLLAAADVKGSNGISLEFKNVAGSIALKATPAGFAALSNELNAAGVRKALVVDVTELERDPLGYSTLAPNKILWVQDTFARLTSGNALVPGAAAVEVTNGITVAQAATIDALSALPADTLYNLSDTAANLAGAGAAALNRSVSATATTDASFAQAATISASTAKLTYNITGADTTFDATGIAKANNITITGTAGLSAANAATVFAAANTGTTTIAKVVGTGAELAALTKTANDTVTLATLSANTAATVSQAGKIVALATTATYALNDSAANLAAAASSLLNGATTNGTAKAIVANTAATVAQATIIDGATPADAATSFAIGDSAANLLAADVALLAKSNAVITVSNSTLTAGDATSLRALDSANTTFAIDVGAKAVKDTAANLLLSANATAVAGAASITVDGAVSVADAVRVRTAAGALAVTYDLADTFAVLGLQTNLATVNSSTNVTVTSDVSVAQAAVADAWLNAGTLTFNVADTAANLTAARLANSTMLTSASSVKLLGTATVDQAGAISEIVKLSGGYAISDTATEVYSALNQRNGINLDDRGSLLGASSIALTTAASVDQVVGSATQRGLSSISGLSYRIVDTGATLATTLGGANASRITAATDVSLSNFAGITVAQYNSLVNNLGTKFKGHDHDSNPATAGRYYLSDSAENLIRATSSVISGSTTTVVKDSYANLITNGGLTDVKNVLNITNVNVEITDASLTVAQYTQVDTQNAAGTLVGPANLSGTAAELAVLGAGILGAADRTSITVTGATAAASDLNAIDAATAAPINATAVATITGSAIDLINATDNQITLATAGNAALTVNAGQATVVQANILAAATTGIVTATISDTALASLVGLSETGNAYTITVNGATQSAADLTAVDAKTTVTVTSNATTLSGTAAEVIAAYDANTAGTITGLGDEQVSITGVSINVATANAVAAKTTGAVTASISETAMAALLGLNEVGNAYTVNVVDAFQAAADLVALDAKTTVVVTSTAGSILGSAAQIIDATDNQGTIATPANVALTVNSGTATVAQANSLDAATGGVVTANISDTAMATLLTLTGTGNAYTMTATDATQAAVDLTSLDAKTTVAVATSATTITGTAVDVLAAYNAAGISGLGNEAITVAGNIEVAVANDIADGTTGVVTATISNNDIATLSGLAETGNAYTVTVTGTASAAQMISLDGKTTVAVNANGLTTLTGTVADIKTVIASSTTIQTGGNYGVTIDASANEAAVDLNAIDAATSGLVNATAVASVNGSIEQLLDASDNQATIDTAGDVALTLTSTQGAASDISLLAGRTTGNVNIGSVVTMTGTAAQATAAFNAVNVTNDAGQAVTLSDTTLAAADLNALNLLTTGVINAGSVTTLTGSTADVTLSYDENTAGRVSGLGDEAVTLNDTTLAATALNTLNGLTTGAVSAATVTTLTGLIADVSTAYTAPGVTGLGNEAVTLNDASLAAADLNALDGQTIGLIDATTATLITGSAAGLDNATDVQATIATAANANLTVDAGTASVASANTLAGRTTGVVTATITETDMATLNGLLEIGNAYTVTVADAAQAAANLVALDAKTTVVVTSNATTIDGNAVDVLDATNDQTTIATLANVNLTVNAGPAVTVADANTLAGRTTGVVTASILETDVTTLLTLNETGHAYTMTVADAAQLAADLVSLDAKTTVVVTSTATNIAGSAVDVIDSTDNQATIDTLANVNLTVLGTASVVQANTMAGATTGVVTATITETDLATLGNLVGAGQAYTITVADATQAAAGLNSLNAVTTVPVTSNATTVTGTTNEVITAYLANIAGTITGLNNEAVTLAAGAVTAADLNSIDGYTSGVVDAKLSNTITGTAADFGTLLTGQSNNAITLATNFDASITGISTVAQASNVDAVTTGIVTAADIVDNYLAVQSAAVTVMNPALQVTANGTTAAQTIDLSVFAAGPGGRGIIVNADAGDDAVIGSSGNDLITGGTGSDTLTGRTGDDIYVYNGTADIGANELIVELNGAGTDRIRVTADTDFTGINVANDSSFDEIEIQGNTTATFTGTQLIGETLSLIGDPGLNALVVTATANAATNLQNITASASWNSLIDTVTINGDIVGNEFITGTQTADRIFGLGGNDSLFGAGGADTLTGGTGDDRYRYDAQSDVDANEQIVELPGEGTDRIDLFGSIDFSSMAVGNFDEIERIGFFGAFTATFTGAQLDGETVTLFGAAGVQSLQVNVAAGSSVDLSNITPDATWTAGQDTVTITGDAIGSETIIGTANADSIDALGGNDVITGGLGADTLTGGSGNDTYIYNGTADVAATEQIVEQVGGGTDRIRIDGITDFTAMADANFDEVEQLEIAGGFTATFNATQLNNETLALIGAGGAGSVVEVNALPGGGTFLQNLVPSVGWIDGTDRVVVNGSPFNDNINGSQAADSIVGDAGSDDLTGNAGSDTFVMNSLVGSDTIYDFALGAGGDVLQVDVGDLGLAGDDIYLGNAAGVDANGTQEIVVLNDVGYANDSDAATAVAGTVTAAGLDMVIVYFNTTTNKVHVIHTTNSDDHTAAVITSVAVMNNVTTLADLQTAVLGNFGGRP